MKTPGDGRPRVRGSLGLALALAFAAALTSGPTHAQIGVLTFQSLFFDQASNSRFGNYVDAQAGMIYTDNAALTRNGSGDTLALLGLVADTAEVGPRLEYRLSSDISFIKYLKESFQTRPYGYLDGSLEFKLLPGFLSWTARDTYVDAVIQPTAPVTPDNLEGINLVTTGPRITLRPTLRTTVVLDGTYSYMSSSSQSPLYVNVDNHRYAGDLKIEQALTNSSIVYVAGDYQKVDFKDVLINTNFKQEDASLGYSFANARTVLDISGGYTKLRVGPETRSVVVFGGQTRLQTIDESPTGGTYRLEISRLLAPTQRVSVHAFQQVADAANMFRLNVDSPVATIQPFNLATGQPFTDREFGGDYLFQASRTAFDLALVDVKQLYKLQPTLDREIKVASVFATRELNPAMALNLGVAYAHQDFATFSSNNEVNLITSLRWQLGERLAVRFLYLHSSLNPNGYQENQVGVMVAYAFVGTPRAMTSPAQLLPTSPMSSQFPAQAPQSVQ